MNGIDIGPHRPSPQQARAQADATAVRRNQQAADFLKLVRILHSTQIAPQFTQQTGLTPEFLDSLGYLAGGMPTRVDTLSSSRGEFYDRAIGKHGRGELRLTPTESGYYSYRPAQMRATAAHEFGHLMDAAEPGLLREFVVRNPKMPKNPLIFGREDYSPQKEWFADAFAQAVRHVYPSIGEVDAYQYPSSAWAINNAQQQFLDSIVGARAKVGK